MDCKFQDIAITKKGKLPNEEIFNLRGVEIQQITFSDTEILISFEERVGENGEIVINSVE